MAYLQRLVVGLAPGTTNLAHGRIPCSKRWAVGEGAAGILPNNTRWFADRIWGGWRIEVHLPTIETRKMNQTAVIRLHLTTIEFEELKREVTGRVLAGCAGVSDRICLRLLEEHENRFREAKIQNEAG